MDYEFDLEDADWNFCEHVLPDKEVRSCLIWECGRECNELLLAELASEYQRDTAPTRWSVEDQKHIKNLPQQRREAKRMLRDLNFDLDEHYRRLYCCHLAFNPFYHQVITHARPWSKPWRLLDKRIRDAAVKSLEDYGIFPPLRHSNLGELKTLWTSNGEEIIAIESGEKKAQRDDTLDMLNFDESHPVELLSEKRDPPVRELAVAFSINFSLFTDNEIIDSFREWLNGVRLCPPPTKKGKKVNDDRVALEGIGIMRALNHVPFSHPQFPSKLKKRGSRGCYKCRQLALKRFHEVFPFLEAISLPMSWETRKSASK